MVRKDKEINSAYSRRDFLAKFGLGLIGVTALGISAGKSLVTPFIKTRKTPNFPKDSIFARRDEPTEKI